MKQLHIISAVEDIPRFVWETQVQLFSARKYGLSDKFRIIVFLPATKTLSGFNPKWKEVEKQFPETKFFYYTDQRGLVTDLIVNYHYLPVHRLCSLEKHFKDHPELEKDAILYIDSDVIFTKEPPLEAYIQDDVNYLSDTKSYLNEAYLDSKLKDVRADKVQEYLQANVIEKAASFAKITVDVLKENNDNTGGAQYLLKNMTSKFFTDCITTCLMVRMFFKEINFRCFPGDTPKEKEDAGIQSWCADMWAIQWNLWRHKMPSETPKWMNFAWATDEIEKLEQVWMLHNTGITGPNSIRVTKMDGSASLRDENGNPVIVEAPCLWKDAYKMLSPFDFMEDVQKVIDHEDSQKYCTSRYAQEVLDTYNTIIKK